MLKFTKQSFARSLLLHLILVSILLSGVCGQKTQETEDKAQFVKVGTQISGTISMNRPNETVFLMEIGTSKTPNSVLFFQGASIKDEAREISITVLKTDSTEGPSLLECSGIQFGDCFLDAQQLKDIEHLTIVISCDNSKKQCSFSFNSFWNMLSELPVDQNVIIQFKGYEDNKIYTFDGTKLQGQDIIQFSIILLPITQGKSSQKFFKRTKLLVNNNGQNPTPNSYVFESLEIWNQGQGIFMSKQDVVGKKLNILVDGQKNQIFSIKCQAIKSKQRKVPFRLYLHDYIKQDNRRFYYLDFDQLTTQKEDQTIYYLQFSVFEGSLSIAFFKDAQYQVPFETGGTIFYNGQSRYSFSKQSLLENDVKSLYIRINSSQVATTFSVLFDSHIPNSNQSAIELRKNVYQLISIKDTQMFYYRYLESGGGVEALEYRFTVYQFINPSQFDKHNPIELRICKGRSKLSTCLDKQEQSTAKLAQGTHYIATKDQNSGIRTYDITIKKQEFDLSKYRSVFIIIEAAVTANYTNGFLSIFVEDKNFVKMISQNFVLQQKVSTNQTNYYVYKNFNKKILQKLSINLFKVSGKITAYVTREDPRWKEIKNLTVIKPEISRAPGQEHLLFSLNNNLQMTEQLYATKTPIFITVVGYARSNFYINCQPTTKQQQQQQDQKKNNKTQENPLIYGAIIAQSQKEHSFIVKSLETQVLIFKPTGFSETIMIQIKAASAVGLCQIQNYSQTCKNKAQMLRGNILRKNSTVKKQGQQFAAIMYRVLSISEQKAIQVTASFHQFDSSQCVVKQIGKAGHQAIGKQACFKYKLNRTSSNIIGYFQRTEIAPIQIMVYVCNQEYKARESFKFQITHQEITDFCSKRTEVIKSQDLEVVIILSSPFAIENDTEKMKIRYSLQYADQTLYIPDGVALKEQVIQKAGKKRIVSPITDLIPNPIKKYYFRLINNIDTNIIVNQISGTRQLSIFVIIGKDEHIQNQKDLKNATVYNSNLKQQSKPYFTNSNGHSFLKITKQQIQQEDCNQRDCTLAIYINDGEDISNGLKQKKVMYAIQVSQNSVIMSEHVLYGSFLLKDQSIFYRYDCKKFGEKVFFQAQDNDQQCVQILVGSNQFTGSKDSQNSINANQVTVQCPSQLGEKPQKKDNPQIHYSQFESIFFTIKATSDCPVTSSVQSTSYKFKNIQPGVPYKVSLNPGQVQFFSFRHLSPSIGFKIVTMQTHGNIKIYANQSTTEIWKFFYEQKAQNTNDFKDLPYRSFNLKNNFFNSLEVNQKDKGYCSKCTYIVAVQAIDKLIESSILFIERNPTQNSMEILLNPNQYFYDQIDQRQQPTVLKVHKALKGKVYIDVLQGEINVNVRNQGKQVQRTAVNLNKKQIIQYDFIDKGTNKGIDFWDPITIEISNPSFNAFKAVYYVLVTPTDDDQLKADLIRQGVPHDINIDQNSQDNQCVKGDLSLNGADQQKFQILGEGIDYGSLKFIFKINQIDRSQFLLIQKYTSGVELAYKSIEQSQRKRINSYVLCIKMAKIKGKTGHLSVIQSSNTNLLAQNQLSLISSQQNFIVHPKAPNYKFVLDIFTCFGNTRMFVANQYADMQQEQPLKDIHSRQIDDLTKIAIPWQNQSHHVFSVTKDEDTASAKFLHFESKLAAVKWLPYDEDKEIGTGYENFIPGNIDYSISRKQLQVKFEPLQKINHGNKHVKQEAIDQKFRVIIGSEVEKIRSAANCQSSSDRNINNGFYWTQVNLKEVKNYGSDKMIQLNIQKEDLRKAILNQQRRMLKQQPKASTFIDGKNQQYNDKVYVILVANVEIKSENSDIQSYHFTYRILDLPKKQTLNDDNSLTSLIKQNFIAFIVLCSILTLLMLTCVVRICLKSLLPMLGKLWNKQSLVEEENPEQQIKNSKKQENEKEKEDVPVQSGTQMVKNSEQVKDI